MAAGGAQPSPWSVRRRFGVRGDEAVDLCRGDTAGGPDLDPCELAGLEESIDRRAGDTKCRSCFGNGEKQAAVDRSADEGLRSVGLGECGWVM